MPAEFDIIRQYFQRRIDDEQLLLGIGDDGAVIRPRHGHDQVVVTDTVIEGRHFPPQFPAADIGWRALAVNLSDIAAMGATPRFAFLNLSLPFAVEDWLQEFARGFFECAQASNTLLAGGDTTQGPMSITVTVIGEVPQGQAVRRSGARPGDFVCVSGTPGEAAAGLELLQQGVHEHALVQRFRRPQPRLALGVALRDIATAMIDISDGLLADLGHVLAASGVGARIDIDKLPVSGALLEYAERPADYVLAGGDDYELCFTVPADQRNRLTSMGEGDVTVIGEITAERALRVVDPDGNDWQPLRRGWTHFSTENNNEA